MAQKLIGAKEVCRMLGGVSVMWIERALERNDGFPKPFTLSDCRYARRYWFEAEVREWFEARLAKRHEERAA